MLVQRREHSAGSRAMPLWQVQLHKYHRDSANEKGRFTALVTQTVHELQSLTIFVQGGAQRTVVDQQTTLISRLLTQIERRIHDDPNLAAAISDYPLITAALAKRAARLELAQSEIASEHNEKQLEFNGLVAQAGRDIDLVRDMASSQNQDAKWAKQLGARLRSVAESLIHLLAEGDDTLNTELPPVIAEWLQRTKLLIQKENKS